MNNIKNTSFYHSLRFKLTLILVLIMGAWMTLTWTTSHIFLEKFYFSNVKSDLINTYKTINTMLSGENNVNAIMSKNYYSNSNFDIAIAAVDFMGTAKVEYTTLNDDYVASENMRNLFKLVSYSAMDQSWTFRENPDAEHDDAGKYIIQQDRNTKISTDYYDLIGVLDNGHLIIIQTPLESIKQSAAISNKFFAYIGIIFTLLGCIVMFWVSNSFSKPIQRMAVIAKRMSRLDFDAKVVKFSNDEIGELGHSMNELSEKLEEAVSELKTANNELRKDIDKKTQIDEMRKEFLSHVSHELKTPIALIQGYAEGLKDNILDDEESKEFYCDVIIDESSKMNKMVKKLLALNEIEFGTDRVQIEHFNVTELIGNVIAQSDILIKKSNTPVYQEFDDPIYVWADEFMIEEVVTNYLTNALNHVSSDGYIRIYTEKKEHEVRVHVFNIGEPIAEEDLEKLWIKFYKADKARSREYGGNGIGLSIVAATMTAHGKAYGVTNMENGVDFYFDLDTENDTTIAG